MTFVLSIEGNLIGWVGNSIILLTASLLLFHMIGIGTLEIHPIIGAIIVSGIIICDVLFTITSLIPYNLRLDEVLESSEVEGINHSREEQYSIVYTFTVSLLLLLQICICYYVITDSFNRAKTHKKYKNSKITKFVFG